VRWARGVVAQRDRTHVADGDHADFAQIVEDGLVVLGDHVRVLRSVEVG